MTKLENMVTRLAEARETKETKDTKVIVQAIASKQSPPPSQSPQSTPATSMITQLSDALGGVSTHKTSTTKSTLVEWGHEEDTDLQIDDSDKEGHVCCHLTRPQADVIRNVAKHHGTFKKWLFE